ncbi:hypothetical protein WR37_10440 [Vibrio parahaemolyticus]|nr:hypothetical protein FORC4_1274 [Vibrio parahaemolyticus]AWG78860.1 hypothetical protein C9I78_08745 [Vibrio parahaemolyticus]AWJ78486.1 hypothetical protein C7Y67_08860 [Vibrio parahaemolyticus]EGR2809439.1 hypothetical protein [Vibrio parahaemolyticus]EGR3227288.1 hypothetical protein [Vibrio parahaemolyticus]
MRYLFLTIASFIVFNAQAAQEITWESLRPQATHYPSVFSGHKALLTEIYVYEVAIEFRQRSPLELDGYNQ